MAHRYSYSPKPFGGGLSFTLDGERLSIESGRKVYEVDLATANTVRMTYEPGRMAKRSFRTKVTLKDGKSFTLSSLTWKSMVEAEELTKEYRAFTHALCTAVARANPQANFIAGKPLGLWLATSALAVASVLALAYLIWQAFRMGATGVALMGAFFVVVGVWQIEPMVRLNKPRPFRAEALPQEMLPKAG